MATRFTQEPWDGIPESLMEWLERFVIAADYNDIKKEKRTQLLSHVIGPNGYSTLKSIFGDKLSGTDFENVVAQLKSCVCPARLTMLERKAFYSMVQQPGETTSTFLSRLQRQARACEFSDEKLM